MKTLLLILGATFFFIFYLFSKIPYLQGGVVKNIVFEGQAYFFLALACVLLVSSYYSQKTSKGGIAESSDASDETGKTLKDFIPSKHFFYHTIRDFFQKYTFYIGCICLYIGFYLLFDLFLGSRDSIANIFLLLFTGLGVLYMLDRKSRLFLPIALLHLSIVSLFYVVVDIRFLTGYSYPFFWVDVVNIGLTFTFLYLFLQRSSVTQYTPWVSTYSSIFLCIQLVTGLTFFFGNPIAWLSLVSIIFAYVYIYHTGYISNILHIPESIVRIWGISFSYIFFGGALYYILGVGGTLGFTFCLLLSWTTWVQYRFHETYENYVSLVFSALGSYVIMYFFYENSVGKENIADYYVYFFWIVSVLYLIWDKYRKGNRTYDSYFYHIVSLIVNLCCVFSFFFFGKLSILNIALFLLAESLYLFISYYTLKKPNNER